MEQHVTILLAREAQRRDLDRAIASVRARIESRLDEIGQDRVQTRQGVLIRERAAAPVEREIKLRGASFTPGEPTDDPPA